MLIQSEMHDQTTTIKCVKIMYGRINILIIYLLSVVYQFIIIVNQLINYFCMYE